MRLLFAVMLAAHASDSKKLLSACYDGNSAKSCLELSESLAKNKSTTDRERAKLARKRACTLGEQAACAAAPVAVVAPEPAETNEIMAIKRSEVESNLSNLPELLEGARLEARTKGYEFVQIEPKSAYERLGFRLGDILLEINGHPLESSPQAMELFVLLRSERDFNVKLQRHGKNIERKYTIKE